MSMSMSMSCSASPKSSVLPLLFLWTSIFKEVCRRKSQTALDLWTCLVKQWPCYTEMPLSLTLSGTLKLWERAI